MRYAPFTERFGPLETELSAAIQAHKSRCRTALEKIDQALARLSTPEGTE